MKPSSLLIFSLLFFSTLFSQQRDLNYYLGQAKTNSPLIHKNKNENRIVELDLNQFKSILSKPEINFEANVLFAPIVSHDNNTNQFKGVSDGATNYNGYDLAATDGGQYQAFVSLKQPLFTGRQYRAYSDKADISRQINENSITLTIHELEQVVRYQYILCLKSKIQSQYSLEILKLLEGHLQIMQKLVENAIFKQTDLMFLQIEYQDFEVEYQTFKAEYKNRFRPCLWDC
jgi:outer membrane protein TolC